MSASDQPQPESTQTMQRGEPYDPLANTRQIKPDSPAKRIEPYMWKPGESGNPSGRPKGIMGSALWDALKKAEGEELQAVVAGILKSCKKGNPKAFAVVRDSVDGRPAQSIDINATVTMTLADRLEAARKAIKEETGE